MYGDGWKRPSRNTNNNKFLRMDNVIFWDMKPFDCDSSVKGECIKNISMDKCIDICDKSKEAKCGYGYYIQTDKETICNPINSENNPSVNPFHLLDKKEKVEELKGTNVSTFVNTTMYKYPPDDVNSVFYLDRALLTSKTSGLSLDIEEQSEKLGNINKSPLSIFKSKDGSIVQLIPVNFYNTVNTQYTSVKYGDNLLFIILRTNHILEKNENNVFEWEIKNLETNDIHHSFKILNKHGESTGKKLVYGDVFTLKYGDIYTCVIEKDTGKFIAIDKNYQQLSLLTNKYEWIFTFIPKMTVYYCNEGKCSPISMEELKTNGESGTYKGKPVYASYTCYGVCNMSEDEMKQGIKSNWIDNDKSIPIIIIKIMIIIFIILFLFLTITLLVKYLKRKKIV